MKRILVGLMIVLAEVVFAFPLTAQRPYILQTSGGYNSQSAYAYFYASDPSDPSGCTEVQGVLSVYTRVYHTPPTPPYKGNSGVLFAAQINVCNEWSYLKFFQTGFDLDPAEFTISTVSARLRKTWVAFDDVSGQDRSMTIDVSWSAIAPATSWHGSQNFHFGDSFQEHTWNGMYRQATTTGTIVEGTTNFTPQAPLDAWIGRGRELWVWR